MFVSLLVHGESKTGKTTLGATAPGKVLFLDAEAGGMRFVPGDIVQWNPRTEGPPEGGWDICRVVLDSTGVLDAVLQWIESEDHPFNSVVLDSLTEYQARLKRELDPSGQLEQRDWLTILVRVENLVSRLLDALERQPDFRALVVICGTAMKDYRFRPMMDGKIVSKLPYKFDVNGYLDRVRDSDGDIRTRLRIEATPEIDAGNRISHAYPDPVIWDPNVETILENI